MQDIPKGAVVVLTPGRHQELCLLGLKAYLIETEWNGNLADCAWLGRSQTVGRGDLYYCQFSKPV